MRISELLIENTESLLVQLVLGRLEKGERVWMNINVDSGPMKYRHEGALGKIREVATKPEWSHLVKDPLTILIDYQPVDRVAGAGRSIILDAGRFDELYTLKKTDYSWELVDVPS